MKKILFAVVLVSAFVSGCASVPLVSEPKRRVLIVSIDGLRPDFYASAEFDAPNLKMAAARGLSADGLVPIFPSLTYPNHVTLVTGVSSARHGVLSNKIYSDEAGDTNDWYFEASRIKVPTLWDKARAAHLTTAIIRWPGSAGAGVDWLIPEIFSSDFNFGEDWNLIRKNTNPALLDHILTLYPTATLKSAAELDEFSVNAAITILREHRPSLALMHLANVDIVQHATGRGSEQTKAAVHALDALLKKLFDAVDLTDTTVIVLGDHGVRDYSKLVNIRYLFRKRGWLSKKAVTVQIEGAQAVVYSRRKSIEPKIMRLLKSNEKGRYRVIGRGELDGLGAYPGALCAIEATDGYSLGTSEQAPLVTDSTGEKGTHGQVPVTGFMDAGFVAFGAGIDKPGRLKRFSVTQVANMVARILGMPADLR